MMGGGGGGGHIFQVKKSFSLPPWFLRPSRGRSDGAQTFTLNARTHFSRATPTSHCSAIYGV